MRVAFAIADKPLVRPNVAVRAGGECSQFWFLQSPHQRDLIPLPGASDTELAALMPPPGSATAVDLDSAGIGDLAAAIATRLQAEAPADMVRQIDVLIVCTTGIDSPIGVSQAGRIKHIIGAKNAFPFMLGQVDGGAAFAALRIARAFLHGPEQARVVAVVASECWRYPYLRSFGRYAQYGDGAAALLLTRDGAGPDIVASAMGRYQDQRGPFDLQLPRWYETPAWPQAVGAFLAGFLRLHGVTGADLAAVDSPCLDAAFIEAAGAAAGLTLVPGSGGFAGSVDPLLPWCGPGAPGLALTWSVGLNGEMGACLYRTEDSHA